MPDSPTIAPDRSSFGSAALRAMHVQIDPPPHVLEDELGLQLIPEAYRHVPPSMEPHVSGRLRASIVARTRYIEDLLVEQVDRGVRQYVILGAGLDTFALRRQDIASRLCVFEVDQPGPQAWKRQRLNELGFDIPEWLRLVPVDFEADQSWRDELVMTGFDASQPAVVACTGVSMYLSREAIMATLRQGATLAPDTTMIMSFLLPLELMEPEEQSQQQTTDKGARASGFPMSSFSPHEMMSMAQEAGFREVQHVASARLAARYFAERSDGLRPSSYQDLLVAMTGHKV